MKKNVLNENNVKYNGRVGEIRTHDCTDQNRMPSASLATTQRILAGVVRFELTLHGIKNRDTTNCATPL